MALLGLATSCAGTPYRARVEARAAREGFERATLRAGGFVLTRYLRASPNADLLVVYLEGDAPAWQPDPLHVTREPPALEPLALELATRDPAPAVAWLGRPCQPVAPADATGCEPSLWSHRRFSEPVVAALGLGLDALRRETGARRLELVGYSGGGVLATLLAARRDDVDRLVTVAAPLDLAAWLALHELGPLEAVDPSRVDAPRLDTLRQHHLAGERDRIVPPEIVLGYGRRRPRARLEVVPGRGHGDWSEDWGERIARIRRKDP